MHCMPYHSQIVGYNVATYSFRHNVAITVSYYLSSATMKGEHEMWYRLCACATVRLSVHFSWVLRSHPTSGEEKSRWEDVRMLLALLNRWYSANRYLLHGETGGLLATGSESTSWQFGLCTVVTFPTVLFFIDSRRRERGELTASIL